MLTMVWILDVSTIGIGTSIEILSKSTPAPPCKSVPVVNSIQTVLKMRAIETHAFLSLPLRVANERGIESAA